MENKIVVLDDDPTGIQTVHDTIVYTSFDVDTLREAFLSPYKLVFLSTNSRSLTEKETRELHEMIISNLFKVKKETGVSFTVLSRGDSTLRGHYPLETETIKGVFETNGISIDGEIICPYLSEIRKTENDIHYVNKNGEWVKCGESEFSKDLTFGYKSSNLKDYVNEKYGREMKSVSYYPSMSNEEIVRMIKEAKDGVKIIVNAVCEDDVRKFTDALRQVPDKNFLTRCAATFVKCFAQIENKQYLDVKDYVSDDNGVLLVAGSHVSKTTAQLNYLMDRVKVSAIEYDLYSKENRDYVSLIDESVKTNPVTVLYTSRKVKDVEGNKEDKLMYSRNVSKEFTSLLTDLKVKPKLIISKGGITSYDVLSNGLKATKMMVLGQVLNAVPVVRLLDGPFNDSIVVVFPGNVGNDDSIYSIINSLS